MPSTNLTTLKAAKNSLLLKPLDAAVFLAPWGTPVPSSFTDASANLQTLPPAFQSVGLIDKKSGVAFARAVTAAPIESYGEMQPMRDDITSDITTLEFEPQQTSALTIALATNVNVQQLAAQANGEVWFAQPSASQITYYTAIVIGKDGTDAAPIYVIKVMPKVAVTKWAGEQWTPTTVLSQKLTLTAFKDDNVGYAVAHGFGGAGWKQLLSKTGINYPVTSISVAPTLALTVGQTSAPLVVTDQLGGVLTPPAVTFNSTVPAKATVAANGAVTGVAAGTTSINVTYTPAGGGAALNTVCNVTVS
ncbi:Ig-like domain-containing protein [Nocardia arthritidis]|uniref:Ig-like domain-containing protein n=1 Tax=Nocardia arthritidis TaxID=228602 RepID=UPI001581FC93|nr:Ig-like domain-containing protein [Nocardia arthritidis]